ncbi:MAG: hypothetical protein JST30_11525 [Armatimonadetes bacterium]|nr:hypothetical protein [Armatimonadota bacterium]
MLAFALAATLQVPVVLEYEPFGGLQIRVGPVPIVRGSAFEYKDPRTGATLYSSRWAPKAVTRASDGSVRVTYTGNGGNALGIHDFRPTPTGVKARYQFQWRGAGTVRVESTYALLWGPAVSHGAASFDGGQGTSLSSPMKGSWEDRKVSAGNTAFRFSSPIGTVAVAFQGSTADLYDVRELPVEWAEKSCLFWLGKSGSTINPGETLDVEAEWSVSPQWHVPGRAEPVALKPVQTPHAKEPSDRPSVIVPRPRSWTPTSGQLILGGDGNGEWSAMLADRTARKFRTATVTTCPVNVSPDAAVSGPESYRLTVKPDGVAVSANGTAATVRAVETLAKLVRPVQGRLAVPCGVVDDGPVVSWRGVHFFSGPDPNGFQRDLVENVLGPLAFNRAVVECERTRWAVLGRSTPSTWASPTDVKSLFEVLRAQGIEPIPLVQSLGHMDWLLTGERSALAVRPETPYVLDVRKKPARDLVVSVWEEAVDILKPRTVHFGLDETDVRGMPDDPTLATRLWEAQVPELVQWARKKSHRTMFWGDMLLAPGQAPDACHGKDGEQGARRHVAAKGLGTVADWHYASFDDPARYTSLPTWRSKGYEPVAASWWRPKNVRAHTLAAIKAGAGTLQTTWAGYAMDERAALREARQGAAYVLAADYSWSGRTETPDKLGYDPLDVFCDSLWRPRRCVADEAGQLWEDPRSGRKGSAKIGETRFSIVGPWTLWTPLSRDGASGTGTIEFTLGTEVRDVCFAADCVAWEDEAAPVARISVEAEDGTKTSVDVLYGADVRAPEDERTVLRYRSAKGLSSIEVHLDGPGQRIRRVVVEPLSQTAGFRIHGVTTL